MPKSEKPTNDSQSTQRQSDARRIRDALVSDILANPVPGQKIPTEAELSRRFGKSRATVREALKLVENEGLVISRQGSGRVISGAVAVRVDRPITRFESATHMLGALGHDHETRVLSVQRIAADAQTAQALNLTPGAQVLRLERLRMAEGRGLFYSINYLDAALVGHLDDTVWQGSVVAVLTDLGRTPTMSRAEVSAAPLPDGPDGLPELAGFGCALVIHECVCDADGQPLLLARDYHRGDSFKFLFERR